MDEPNGTTENHGVGSSILPIGTTFLSVFSWLQARLFVARWDRASLAIHGPDNRQRPSTASATLLQAAVVLAPSVQSRAASIAIG